MISRPESNVRTVSQLTAEIKFLLEGSYRFVNVSGEISNLKTPFSGHHYFTLKDDTAQLRAVMFKTQQRYLAEQLRDGQQVICRGRVSVYEPRGEYQLIVDAIDQHGLGVLQMRFAALKKKLHDEGLFDLNRKRTIPPFPYRVVVISSPTGAAIHDFLKIAQKRATVAAIQIFPVPVQGELAPQAIALAIETVNHHIPCDVIVLCRGGGSIEDLWAFNEEVVARAIAGSVIPIVTGIGHETDTTIADLCADQRAPTPTGAAELLLPDTALLRRQVAGAMARLHFLIHGQIKQADWTMEQQWRHLRRFCQRLEQQSLRLDPVVDKLHHFMAQGLKQREELLDRLGVRLKHQAPLVKIACRQQTLTHLEAELNRRIDTTLIRAEDRLASFSSLLHSVSPLSTLARGYAIVQKRDVITNELTTISSSSQVEKGDELQVRLNEGRLHCEVIDTR